MEKENKIYIALDSDVLRALVDLHLALSNDPKFKTEDSRDYMISKNGDFLKDLLRKIEKDKIRIFVPNTVFHEVKHKKAVCSFIMDFCYLTNLNILNFDEIISKTDELALKYCTMSYEYKGERFFSPLNIHYDPAQRKNVPSNDAYAMAESTLANCILITGNGKDLVYDRFRPDDKNSRSNGIRIINDICGYNTLEEDRTITPRSFELDQFVKMIAKFGWEGFNMPEANMSHMIKASEITI